MRKQTKHFPLKVGEMQNNLQRWSSKPMTGEENQNSGPELVFKIVSPEKSHNLHAAAECMLSHVRLCDPMDCNLPGSSIHGILQARVLGWVAICFSRGSSWSRDWTWISCFMGRLFMVWATRQSTLGKVKNSRKGIIVWSVVKLWVDQPD